MKRADWAKTESFHKSSRQLLIVYYDSYYFAAKILKRIHFFNIFRGQLLTLPP